jgi:hypothetical protein
MNDESLMTKEAAGTMPAASRVRVRRQSRATSSDASPT